MTAVYRGHAVRLCWGTGWPTDPDLDPCRCKAPVEMYLIPHRARTIRRDTRRTPGGNCAIVWRCTECQATIVDPIVLSFQV